MRSTTNEAALFNFESLKAHIEKPNLERFASSLSKQELAMLTVAVMKIKLSQCVQFASEIRKELCRAPFVGNKEILRALFLTTTTSEQARAIFNTKVEEDKQLEALPESASHLSAYRRLRHGLYLDRSLPEWKNCPTSQALLHKSYSGKGVSFYLTNKDLTPQECSALEQAYPLEKFNQPLVLREAHQDIRLTLYDMQMLMINVVEAYLSRNVDASTDIQEISLKPMRDFSAPYFRNYIEYTNRAAFECVKLGQLEGLKICIKLNGDSATIVNHHTQLSLLSYAIQLQKKDFVTYLLKNGAEVNQPDRSGDSPLHYAVASKHTEIFDAVLAARCDLNAQNEYGFTPLHVAADLDQRDFCEKLLNQGASPFLTLSGNGDWTPLHLAAYRNHSEIIKILLAKVHHIDTMREKAGKLTTLAETKRSLGLSDWPFVPREPMFFNIPFLPLYYLVLPLECVFPIERAFPTKVTSTIPLPKPIINVDTTPPSPELPELQEMLLSPTKYRATLLCQRTLQHYLANESYIPFSVNFPIISDKKELAQNYFQIMAAQRKHYFDAKKRFADALEKIISLSKDPKNVAHVYFEIVKMNHLIDQAGISLSYFAFELYKNGFLEQLITLEKQITPMQLAIDCEDVECIKKIIMDDPNRQPHTIKDNQNTLSELDYAIRQGKVAIVTAMVELAKQRPEVQLGPVPPDAVLRAQKRSNHLVNDNPVFKGVEINYGLDNVRKASERNWIKLLNDLTLPSTETEAIHGLFTSEEYAIVKVLVAEKEENNSRLSTLMAIYKRNLALRRLAERKGEIPKLKEIERAKLSQVDDETVKKEIIEHLQDYDLEIQCIDDTSEYLSHLTLTQIKEASKKRQHHFRIPYGSLQTPNIFKHATNNYSKIKENGHLTTVKEAREKGLLPQDTKVATPIIDQDNIFCSAGGRKSDLTGFRANATHVVEVNVTQAIKQNLITPTQVYTTSHFPAYGIQRVETPLIFIGDDPSKKTILRIYHYRENDENHKMYWFDYYENDQLIKSDHEKLSLEEELYLGDNAKLKAYLLIKYLRKIKGPFTEGSYYHYVLSHANDIDVIESAVATIFNVYNMEGKITASIPIDHPAVTIIENERSKQWAALTNEVRTQILAYVRTNQRAALADLIETKGLHFAHLEFALQEAITLQNEELVTWFLNKGTPAYSPTEKALNLAFQKSCENYRESTDRTAEEEKASQTFLRIAQLLLYHGSSSQYDPEHIRYAASPDNCGKYNNDNSWHDKSLNDSNILINLLNHFRTFSFNEFVLAGVTKQLFHLYNITFHRAFFDEHAYIANRLGKTPLHSSPEILALIDEITENKDTLLDHLTQPLSPDNLKFAFSYAMKIGQLEVIKRLLPAHQALPVSQTPSPFFLAVRFNQMGIFSYLLEALAKNTIHAQPLSILFHLAYTWGQKEALHLLTTKGIVVPTNFITRLIADGQQEDFSSFANNMDIGLKIDDVTKQTVIADISPMIMAIDQNKLTHITLLFDAYKHKWLRDGGQYFPPFLRLLLTSLHYAARHKKVEIFNSLLECYIKFVGENRHNLLMDLFNALRLSTPQDCLISLLNAFATLYSDVLSELTFEKNPLHEVMKTGNLIKLKLLRDTLPTLPYDLSKAPNIEDAILDKANALEMLAFLLHDSQSPLDETQKIKILAAAVLKGKLHFVKWILENMLPKNYVNPEGNNILHLLIVACKEYKLAPSSPTLQINACIDYICYVGGVDVNHQNNKGETIFLCKETIDAFSDPEPSTFLTHFLSCIALYKKTDLSLTSKTRCILHMRFLTPEIIDKYLKQGGDPNWRDTDGLTPLERCLIALNFQHYYFCYENNIEKLRQHCHEPRPALLSLSSIPAKVGFITAKQDGQVYLLFSGNRPVILTDSTLHFSLKRKIPSYGFKGTGEKGGIEHIYDFIHYDASDQLDLKSTKKIGDKIKSPAKSELNWKPVPKELETTPEGLLQAKDQSPFPLISGVFKILLECIACDIPGNILSAEQYNQLMSAKANTIAHLRVLYEKLFSLQQLPSDSTLKKYIQAASSEMPFAIRVKGEKTYPYWIFYSPLMVAIQLAQPALVTKLFKLSNKTEREEALQFAIGINKPAMLELVLKAMGKLTPSQVINYLKLVPRGHFSTVNVFLKLGYLNPAKCTPSILSRFSSWLDSFSQDIKPSNDKDYEDVMRFAAELPQTEIKPNKKKRPATTPQGKGASKKKQRAEPPTPSPDSEPIPVMIGIPIGSQVVQTPLPNTMPSPQIARPPSNNFGAPSTSTLFPPPPAPVSQDQNGKRPLPSTPEDEKNSLPSKPIIKKRRR